MAHTYFIEPNSLTGNQVQINRVKDRLLSSIIRPDVTNLDQESAELYQ